MTHSDGDLLKLAERRLRAAINKNDFDCEFGGSKPLDDVRVLLDEYDRLSASASTAGRGEVVAWQWRCSVPEVDGPMWLGWTDTDEAGYRAIAEKIASGDYGPKDWQVRELCVASPPAAETASCKICSAGVGEACGTSPMQCLAPAVETAGVDARRYQRLRVLGCAPAYTDHLKRGDVMRFTNLDEFVDKDADWTPSRGEATPADTAASVVGDREATIEECAKIAAQTAKRCVREKIPGDSVASFIEREILALTSQGKADAGRKWDQGEHEGCGIDSERAFRASPPAAGGKHPAGMTNAELADAVDRHNQTTALEFSTHDLMNCTAQRLRALVTALASQGKADGGSEWSAVRTGSVLVPREPTREMWAAGGTAAVNKAGYHHDIVAEAVYRAMMDAAPVAQAPGNSGVIEFEYCNWEGRKAIRQARPISIRFGKSEWHPKPQWLLLAFDIDREAEREFAMADMAFDEEDVPPALAVASAPVQGAGNPKP